MDTFMVVSEKLRQTLVQRRSLGQQRVQVIYNGIELDDFDPSCCGQLKKELGLSPETPLIGGIGRMVWQKGFEHLIRAMPAVLEQEPQCRLLLVGKGEMQDELQQLVAELGLLEHVVFGGFRSDMAEVLASVDMVVVPSLREGFPMITLEAMAMAKPIIATDIDGTQEQIDNHRHGILVQPGQSKSLAEAIPVVLLSGQKLCPS